ncbi:MAG: TRAP transporter small permease subunit [Deltaproteobacteria bacterium]
MWKRVRHAINYVTEKAGEISKWLLLVLVAFATLEAILRYVFNAPTIWIWDVNIQVLAILTIFGGPYIIPHDGHVKTDILYTQFSTKTKAFLDSCTYLIYLFVMAFLLWLSAVEMLESVRRQEKLSTFWEPPIYPLKIIIVIGFVMMLSQGVVKFVHELQVVLKEGKIDEP